MIVTSRAAVPVFVCDLEITIGDRSVPGSVLHLGTVTVLTVQPHLLPPLLFIPRISTKHWIVGDEIELFSLNDEHQLVQKRTQISSICGVTTRQCNPPRWRITNTEGISLLECPYSNGGILIDPVEKSVIALWMVVTSQNSSGKNTSWKVGLSYDFYIRPVVESLRSGKDVESRCSGWEFEHMQLSSAMSLGLTETRAVKISSIAKSIGAVARPIFVTGKLKPPSQTEDDLKIGDVILEINGEPVGRMADTRCLSRLESAKITVLRNGQEMEITVHTKPVLSQSTPRVICWAGAIVHETPSSVLEQTTPEFLRVSFREAITHIEKAVYTSGVMYGSPAFGNLRPVHWILEIDGCKVRSLDDLLETISSLEESEEYIRVKILSRKGITSVVSVRLDSNFWTAWILERKGNNWVRRELE